jgi:hypothetical protein
MTQDTKTSQPIQGFTNHEDVEQIETLSPHANNNINKKNETKEETAPAAEYVTEYNEQVSLSWRSWMVVLVSCFAIVAQVFVVTAASSVIAFIIRDLGKDSPDASALAGWIIRMSFNTPGTRVVFILMMMNIEGPLLMQSVLSPIVGRLSDVLDRKYIASVPPLIAFVGAVISAKATSISMLIGGGILIGATLSTIAIVQAIPSEILPLKHRALANGFAYMGGAIGGM